MKLNFLKVLLMSTVLTPGFNLVAMEQCPEPMNLSSDDQVVLQSQDGHDFKVEVSIARQSQTLKNLIEDAGIDAPIPLPNISGKTLANIIQILKRQDRLQTQNIKESDLPRELARIVHEELYGMPINQIMDLFFAANFLDIPDVLHAIASEIADRIPANVRMVALRAMRMPADKKNEAIQLLSHLKLDYLTAYFMNRDLWQIIASHVIQKWKQEWITAQDDRSDTIYMKPSDGYAIEVPFWVAAHSGMIEALAEDVGIHELIPLNFISLTTLNILIPLIREYAWLEAWHKQDSEVNVNNEFQLKVRQALENVNNKQVIKLFVATDYLDIPFIFNAMATIIAQRIPEDIRQEALQALLMTRDQRDDETQILNRLQLDYLTHEFIHSGLQGVIANRLAEIINQSKAGNRQ